MELKEIPGIGDKTAAALIKAEITTVDELLHTYPRTYRTYESRTTRTARLGEWVTLQGVITKPTSHHKGRISIQRATFRDDEGALELRWFNMPYITRSLEEDGQYQVMGKVEVFGGRLQIVSPSTKLLHKTRAVQNFMVPVYRQMGSLKPWVLREKIKSTIAHISLQVDPLSPSVINKYNLLDYHQALEYIHQPPSQDDLTRAIRRLSWQELYELQLESVKEKKKRRKKGVAIKYNEKKIKEFLGSLPFELTTSQKAAIDEILLELGKGYSMSRLLQGEVGSGKTIVAAALAYATATAGYRILIMAPTQILATQLHASLSSMLTPKGVTVSLVMGTSKAKKDGQIIVGTQALLNKEWDNIGLVIVDEQHRFGVEQREALTKGEISPHFLMMTATPIPRTLAMTVFSYLEMTRLIDMPKGRLPTKTYLVPEPKRLDSYTWINKQIDENNRIFFVTPLIEVAEEQEEAPLKSVKELQTSLTRHFPNRVIDVMHGKMKTVEKAVAFARFQSGATDILVATSMIEVGIDVPEANIMVIEDADRFGLSQLHQLRGRVGRGGDQGYCLLFTKNASSKVQERLAYFLRNTDGEKLAKYDLQNRGAGELFGSQQHGFFNLALGSMWDEEMLRETAEAARIHRI